MPGMIDVSGKEITKRIAKACGFIWLGTEITQKVKNNELPKGNVLEHARIAGIMGAKKTPELLPLCHFLLLNKISLEFEIRDEGIYIEAVAIAEAKTGVEMEALIACSTAALTIYDMCKMFSQTIEIQNVHLLEKSGGKTDYKRK